MPLGRDRIEAAKNVVMMDLALLNAEIANGMYKKPVEHLAKEIRSGRRLWRGQCPPNPEEISILVRRPSPPHLITPSPTFGHSSQRNKVLAKLDHEIEDLPSE